MFDFFKVIFFLNFWKYLVWPFPLICWGYHTRFIWFDIWKTSNRIILWGELDEACIYKRSKFGLGFLFELFVGFFYQPIVGVILLLECQWKDSNSSSFSSPLPINS